MNCPSVAAVLDLFCEDLLAPSRRVEVEAHLKDCAACAQARATLRPARPTPKAAPTRLKQRLRLALDRPAAPIKGSPRCRRDSSAAALILAAFALGLLAMHALAPGPLSQRPVACAAAPWRLP